MFRLCFTVDIHRQYSTGVSNQMKDGWIPFSCLGFRVVELRAGSLSHWLTGTLEQNRAIVNVSSNTCAFHTMTSQHIHCEKPYRHLITLTGNILNQKDTITTMKGFMCIMQVSVSRCSTGRQLISNETLQVEFNMWRELLKLLKLFSPRGEAPFWMTRRALAVTDVHISWILVNLHHALQHYYHSVCVLSIREGGDLHMMEKKCSVNMKIWLMADTSSRGPLLSHVWCLHIVIKWIWCLYCFSVGCKTLYVRSLKMWVSLPVWPIYELCRKPPWKTWNKPLHKLEKDFALLFSWWSVQR